MRAKVLVTGGAGYIGSILVPALLDAGHDVAVLDNLLFRQTSLLDCCHRKNFQFIVGDCRDREALRQPLRDADYILPLAAIVGAPACRRDKTAAVSTNLEAIR